MFFNTTHQPPLLLLLPPLPRRSRPPPCPLPAPPPGVPPPGDGLVRPPSSVRSAVPTDPAPLDAASQHLSAASAPAFAGPPTAPPPFAASPHRLDVFYSLLTFGFMDDIDWSLDDNHNYSPATWNSILAHLNACHVAPVAVAPAPMHRCP